MTNATGMDYLAERGISPETASQLGIYTCRMDADRKVIPHPRGNILAFPFIERGVVVAEKFRAEPKRFWQRPGGKRTFWNSDVLDDPAVIDGRLPVVITEGEFDAASAVESGMPTAVSVPDGAPPEGKVGDDVDDSTGKFEFLFRNRERLQLIKRFVLAVDNDGPGARLSDELVRRLGAWRCSFVTYPEGCKDLNDVLRNEGPEEVIRIINGAQPFPVRGLYRLGDYQQRDLVTYSTGWSTLDAHCKLWFGEFMVVTGIPSMGKSTFMLNLLAHTALAYGWKSAIFSPEMPTVPHLAGKLTRILDRRTQDPERFINSSFTFIDTDPNGNSDDDLTLEWVMERAVDAVMRDGIRVLLIDPWNEVEQMRRRDETQTEYIGRAIRTLKRFAKQYGVIVIVVAHPTKEVSEHGKMRSPTMYDIDGSAHWFNKCDHGIIVHRPDWTTTISEISIAKSRFEEAGEKGMVKLNFDRYNSRYELLNTPEAPLL